VAEERRAVVDRATRETRIHVELAIDGTGRTELGSGVAFLDHMLDALARHGLFDLVVRAEGDLEVEAHHTIEDTAIALGRALDQALGQRRGIVRMGHSYAPLDEALGFVVVDCGGRGYAVVDAPLVGQIVGGVDADMFRHFFESLAIEARINVHARVVAGVNAHHKVEALFKAFARTRDSATRCRRPRARSEAPGTAVRAVLET
jgi:imidazoleglycerol-phosphate dehydratase